MKKIIAFAVAGAFVAPVMAADVTISGSTVFNYISNDKAATDAKLESDDNNVKVSASQDLDNGLSVSATFALVDDTSNGLDTQGSSLSISSAEMGKLTLGDTSGALDATGDYTDVSPVFGGYFLDGGDMNMAWTLPTLVEGLKAVVSHSPSGDNYTNDEIGNDGNANNDGTLGAREGEDASAYSLTYTFGNVSVYYGEESYSQKGAANQTTDTEAFGVKYSTGPLMVAYESGSASNADVGASKFRTNSTAIADGDFDATGLAVTYKMGSTTLGGEMQQVEATTGTVETKIDETTLFVHQDLGNGVSVYAATTEDTGNGSDTRPFHVRQSGLSSRSN